MKYLSIGILLLVAVVGVFLFRDRLKRPTGPSPLVFQSADGGQTWQDISTGLPEKLQEAGVPGNAVAVTEDGLLVKAGRAVYRYTPHATNPSWTREDSTRENGSAFPRAGSKTTYTYWGVQLDKTNGTKVWSPLFDDIGEPRLRSVFETAQGSLFIGTNKGLFRTADNGKTWKQVHEGGGVGHLAERNGVLLAISMSNIIQSTDDGEHWTPVTNSDLVYWDVKAVPSGFAALTSHSDKGRRSLRTSTDGGNTWQVPEGEDQPGSVADSLRKTWNDRPTTKAYSTSVMQSGDTLLCTHPLGIYRSTDRGKNWQLVLPSMGKKFFILHMYGNLMYAIPTQGGC